MKKFIVAIDGLKYSPASIDYAIGLARQARAHLVGVFLDDFTYHSYKIYELVGDEEENENIMIRRQKLEEKDESMRKLAVEYFKDACSAARLEHTIHHDRNIALRELLHESIYADLLIIDRKETFTHYEEEEPTRFIKELLANVECPVVTVPHKYTPIKKVIMLYDGGPSSVYAIRAYGNVFSSIGLPIEIVTVKKPGLHKHVPDNRLMKEFTKRHFPDASFTVLTGDPEIEIARYLVNEQNNAIVVIGAYQRGMVSRWFKPSLADLLMKDLSVPLFIAHNK